LADEEIDNDRTCKEKDEFWRSPGIKEDARQKNPPVPEHKGNQVVNDQKTWQKIE
jgi:hypothetical protein